jgi:6-phosphogluconolactonase
LQPTEQVRVLPTADAVAAAAADELLAALRSTPATRAFALAVSGGETPRRLFRLLARSPYPEAMRERVHFFWVDERLVPPESDESNYGTAARLFLAPAGVPAAHVHRVRTEVGSAEDVAADYEAELRRHFATIEGGAVNGVPRFDAVLLGIGADGHTASLFPGSRALHEHRRWVTAVDSATPARVTLTYPVLNNAARVLFMVTGRSKQEILRRVLDRSRAAQYPAQRIRPTNGVLLWLVDSDAHGS